MRTLEGKRVYLRPMAAQDTDHILRWRSDPAVMSQLFSERPPSRIEHEQWLANLQRDGTRQEFVIVLRDIGQPVGTVGLSQIDRREGTAEYGILMGEEAWRGKKLAREASELIIEYGFTQLELTRIELHHFSDNLPAHRLYVALGFVENKDCAGTREKDGETRTTKTMQLSVGSWRSR